MEVSLINRKLSFISVIVTTFDKKSGGATFLVALHKGMSFGVSDIMFVCYSLYIAGICLNVQAVSLATTLDLCFFWDMVKDWAPFLR